MLKELEVRDFMAHSCSKLELAPGVTVLVGDNNTGKSAIVEALRCLMTNPPPGRMLRHGATKAEVTLTLDDGERITWERRKASATYHIECEGQRESFARLGRGHVPREVQRRLRLRPVEFEDAVFDIHVAGQREPVFLLDRSGAQTAAFFAASTEAEHLLRMQQRFKQRVADTRVLHKRAVAEVETLSRALERLSPLGELGEELERLRASYQRLTQRHGEVPRLRARLDEKRALEGRRDRCSRKAAALSNLKPPPDLAELRPLEHLVRDLRLTGEVCQRDERVGAVLSLVDQPPELVDSAPLAQLVRQLRDAERQRSRWARCAQRLQPLAEPPELADTETPAGFLRELDGALAHVRQARAAARELKGERKRVERELAALVEEVRDCPTCGQPLSVEDVLRHGTEHADHASL